MSAHLFGGCPFFFNPPAIPNSGILTHKDLRTLFLIIYQVKSKRTNYNHVIPPPPLQGWLMMQDKVMVPTSKDTDGFRRQGKRVVFNLFPNWYTLSLRVTFW